MAWQSTDAHGKRTSHTAGVVDCAVLAAILFAVGHLPAAAEIELPLDTLVVTRTLVLNIPLGIAFGWLYWKRGLETAMLPHCCSDMLVAVIAPLVFANWIR